MPAHRINRAQIHLRVPGPELAAELIDRCSELHARAIAPLIDRVCSELSGPDRVDRIDHLELDLGALAPAEFEAQLLSKLEASLRTGLQRALAARQAVDRGRSAIELLETFATLGNLPWWSGTAGDPVAAALSNLCDDDPRVLLELVHLLASDRPALTRLARHAHERVLATLVARRWPAGEPALLVAVRSLERALPGATDVLRSALFVAIASVEHDPSRVLTTLLRELVAHGGHTPGLRARLAAMCDAPDLPPLLHAALTAIGPPRAVTGQSPREHSGDQRASWLTGSGEPRAHAAPHGPAIPRVTGASPTTTLAPTAAASPPTSASTTSPGPPLATVASPPTSASTTSPAPPLATAASLPTPRAAPRDTPLAAHARSPTTRRPETPQSALHARSFARIDDLHVEDGGLVLLWPFLDRLCLRCGLLDEQRRFVDEPAQHRAVALFEMIVTGELAPPEFRLPLAKLLAGLRPDASLMLASPLDPAWRDECDRLLVAVVGHAPTLADLDPPGLRASFLRRAAALGVRDGAWTLQVERAAHDFMLDRVPWSWSWVRLPWMPETLRVEW